MVYIDESGFVSELQKTRSWSKIGQPTISERSGQRQKRWNLFCGLNANFEPVAPFLTDENCCAENFEEWFEQEFLWSIDPNAVIIMDNARFHRKAFLFELIKTVNAWYDTNFQLLFLPPYSPDFNPIEHYFAVLKNKVRSLSSQGLGVLQGLKVVLDI